MITNYSLNETYRAQIYLISCKLDYRIRRILPKIEEVGLYQTYEVAAKDRIRSRDLIN